MLLEVRRVTHTQDDPATAVAQLVQHPRHGHVGDRGRVLVSYGAQRAQELLEEVRVRVRVRVRDRVRVRVRVRARARVRVRVSSWKSAQLG